MPNLWQNVKHVLWGGSFKLFVLMFYVPDFGDPALLQPAAGLPRLFLGARAATTGGISKYILNKVMKHILSQTHTKLVQNIVMHDRFSYTRKKLFLFQYWHLPQLSVINKLINRYMNILNGGPTNNTFMVLPNISDKIPLQIISSTKRYKHGLAAKADILRYGGNRVYLLSNNTWEKGQRNWCCDVINTCLPFLEAAQPPSAFVRTILIRYFLRFAQPTSRSPQPTDLARFSCTGSPA